MYFSRSLALILGCTVGALAQTPPANYFTTTAAGFVPPSFNPIALKQYVSPNWVAYDPAGRLYYESGDQVWRLNADGTDTLYAGTPNSTENTGDGGPAPEAGIHAISGMGIDGAGNLFILTQNISTSTGYPTVRKISAATQTISTLLIINGYGSDIEVSGFTVDTAGNFYFAARSKSLAAMSGFSDNGYLFVGSPTGDVSIVTPQVSGESMASGGTYLYYLDNDLGLYQINLESAGSQPVLLLDQTVAQNFAYLAVAPDGTVYLTTASQIYLLPPSGGTPEAIAGTAIEGYAGDGGLASQAQITANYLAVNPVTGDYAMSGKGVVRVVARASGSIQTVAGLPHSAGDNGPAVLAQFGDGVLPGTHSQALATDAAGNMYLFDTIGQQVRKITPQGIITTIAGNGVVGDSGDGAKAVDAAIWSTNSSLAADPHGNLYFANSSVTTSSAGIAAFYTVRRVDAATGNIDVVAGGGAMPVSTGVPATSVALNAPITNLAADSLGDVYFCYNYQILEVDTGGNLMVAAGTGTSGFTADGQTASVSRIRNCAGIIVDSAGDIFYNDGQQLREIKVGGLLHTVAGVEMDDAFYTNALPSGPTAALTYFLGDEGAVDPLVDAAGNIYFATGDLQIGMVDTSGYIWHLAGVSNLNSPSAGDGGDATLATFSAIDGMALGPLVNGAPTIYVYDGIYVRQLTPYDPASPPPYISSGGVVGAGGSLPAVAAAAPGGLESIFGGNFVAPANQHTVGPSDLVNGQVPTTLAGVCVSFGGVPAAMFGVYPSQLNVQTPSVSPGPVTVQVTTNCGKSNAVTSNFGAVAVQAASPEFFSFKPDPVAGQNPVAAINAVTYADVGAPGLLQGVTFIPATGGEVIEAYGTGWGATNPAFGTGVIPGVAGPLAPPYTVIFGGVTLPQSAIIYAGASPCCAGLYQLDFTVPSTTPSGNQTLVIDVNGESSPPGAFIDVQ